MPAGQTYLNEEIKMIDQASQCKKQVGHLFHMLKDPMNNIGKR